jgi:DNA-binding NarL/FixJ family response regulator
MAAAAALCDHAHMAQTVMIVDDHPSFRATARALLESEGFQIVGEAATGAEALAEAEALRPDVVLLDVQLPDLDGFEIAARLTRQNANGPAVVLVSSRDRQDYGHLIGDSGARGFVAKGDLSGAVVRGLLT